MLKKKMESLYYSHIKEMGIYRHAENEKHIKRMKSLTSKDEEVIISSAKPPSVETHIFDDLAALNLEPKVEEAIKNKISQIRQTLEVDLIRS